MTRHSRLWSLFVVIVLACVPVMGAESNVRAFVGVNVVTMTGPDVQRAQTVVVSGDTITAIGPAGSIAIPEGAARIDGAGRYLVPGFTDAHVHLFTAPELPLYVANGVTAVFNLNGHPAHLRWRQQVRDGVRIGPAIYTAGPTFMTGRSESDAVREVEAQAAAGYDAVKIYNGVGDEYGALIEAAKKKNLLLIGHVPRKGGAEATIRSGQSIAHAEELIYSYFNPSGGDGFAAIELDESRIAPLAKLAADGGIVVVPTLSTFRDIIAQATDLSAYLRNPQLRYLAPSLRQGLEPAVNRYHHRYSDEDLAMLRRALPFQRKLMRAFHEAGVPLLTGTDATAIGPVAGFSIHEELKELVNSGLSNYEALRAATVNPARYLRRADSHGTIEEGKKADFLLLAGNPLDDIGNTARIEGVLTAGRWHDADALEAMRAGVLRAYEQERLQLKRWLASDPAAADRHLRENDPFGEVGIDAMAELVTGKTLEEMRAVFRTIDKTLPQSALVREELLNQLGYTLLARGKRDESIALFTINSERHPQSANTFDSLGEALFKTGDVANAVASYRRALVVDPAYGNAAFARDFVEKHGAK